MQLAFFFDTETTDKWNFKSTMSDPAQPHICQLAYMLVQDDKKVIHTHSTLIAPSLYSTIPAETTAIHGISTEQASAYGHPVRKVMEDFLSCVSLADVVVAHNIKFDAKLIARTALELDMKTTLNAYFDSKPQLCTMQASTDLCKIPNPYRGGYKWPKLQELHEYLFNRKFFGAHDALNDVRATVDCFFKMIDIGAITDAA